MKKDVVLMRSQGAFLKKKMAQGGWASANENTVYNPDGTINILAANNSKTAVIPKTSMGNAAGWAGKNQGAISAAGNFAGETVDAFAPVDNYGVRSNGAAIGSGALKGAATGAAIGSIVPGVGTIIGGAVGAVVGGVTGLVGNKSAQKKKAIALDQKATMERQAIDQSAQARIAADPSLRYGRLQASYYRFGGTMKGTGPTPPRIVPAIPAVQAKPRLIPNISTAPARQISKYEDGGVIHIKPENRGKFNATKKATGKSTEELTHSNNPITRKRAIFAQNAAKWNKKENGGKLAPMSSSDIKVEGPSHESGGVSIPALGAELEGGETINNGFVFSKKLGFAKPAEKIARATGRAEQRPDNDINRATVGALQRKTNILKVQQEAAKEAAGIPNDFPTMADGGPIPQQSPKSKSKPTSADSASLYRSGMATYNFYKNNKDYEETKDPIHPHTLKEDIENFGEGYARTETGVRKLKLRDYYKKLNDNQYLKRESASHNMNMQAPMTLYDNRIKPTKFLQMAHKEDGSNLKDDYVAMPMYDLPAIKPWNMLTQQEKLLRTNKDLASILPPAYVPPIEKKTVVSAPTKKTKLSKPKLVSPVQVTPSNPTISNMKEPMMVEKKDGSIGQWGNALPTLSTDRNISLYPKGVVKQSQLDSLGRVNPAARAAIGNPITSSGQAPMYGTDKSDIIKKVVKGVRYANGGKLKRMDDGGMGLRSRRFNSMLSIPGMEQQIEPGMLNEVNIKSTPISKANSMPSLPVLTAPNVLPAYTPSRTIDKSKSSFGSKVGKGLEAAAPFLSNFVNATTKLPLPPLPTLNEEITPNLVDYSASRAEAVRANRGATEATRKNLNSGAAVAATAAANLSQQVRSVGQINEAENNTNTNIRNQTASINAGIKAGNNALKNNYQNELVQRTLKGQELKSENWANIEQKIQGMARDKKMFNLEDQKIMLGFLGSNDSGAGYEAARDIFSKHLSSESLATLDKEVAKMRKSRDEERKDNMKLNRLQLDYLKRKNGATPGTVAELIGKGVSIINTSKEDNAADKTKRK